MKTPPLFPRAMGRPAGELRPLVEKILGSRQKRVRALMLVGLASATLVVSACSRTPVPSSTPVVSTPVVSTPAESTPVATPAPATPSATEETPVASPEPTATPRERIVVKPPPTNGERPPRAVYGMPPRTRDK